jgi:hydroxyacylglutathione hydrolase
VTALTVIPVVDEGLGNTSYVVDLGDGRALAVDASRDLRALREATERHGLTVAYAADTHLHADFLSGACQLAAADNARILASAAGARAFDHQGLHDGDEVDLGGLRLRAVTTPGHTDEHIALLLLDGDRPVGVFTGGSLIVGAAARTDLVDPERTDELARAQYASLQRLLTLPDETLVWPTHGPGSFCSAPAGADRTSTIGRERRTNALLQASNENAFVAALLDSLGSFPPYFRRLGEVNRQGPALLSGPPYPASLRADEVVRLQAGGGAIVDVRQIERYAAAHIPGSVSIELRSVFASWLGWLVPFGVTPVIVRDIDQDLAEIAWQAAKIGYTLAGELEGGIAAWSRAGRPTVSTGVVGPRELDAQQVLDIRQHGEYTAGHVPGARNIELGDVPSRSDEVPAGPVVVMCGHGERAMSAASLIERAGGGPVAVLLGGPADWAAAHRSELETSS